MTNRVGAVATREQKGLQIAKSGGVVRNGSGWLVPSQSGKNRYYVTLDTGSPHCTCPDYEIQRERCKHVFAVEYILKPEASPNGATVAEPCKRTYKQNWRPYNAAKSEEKDRFVVLLSDLCSGVPQLPRLPGAGRSRLPFSDMVFAAAFKVYVGFSARRFTSDLKSACAKGLIGNAAHFNSVNRYIANPNLTGVLKNLVTMSSLPLKAVETDFAVDSSGFSTSRFVRWFNKKYGREVDNREWVKVHLMCGVKTKVVTSVDISGWMAHDTSYYFVPLVETTAKHFQLGDVMADKAYLSHKNLRTVELAGGTPFVPFKSNTVEPTEEEDPLWARMYHYFMYNREAFLERYHKRSNVESAYSMIKTNFGDSVRSKSDTGQINEALCKVLCHNICVLVQAIHELEIEPNFGSETLF
jgi:transposase